MITNTIIFGATKEDEFIRDTSEVFLGIQINLDAAQFMTEDSKHKLAKEIRTILINGVLWNSSLTIYAKNINQIKKTFPNEWETIIDTCNKLVFGPNTDKETFSYFNNCKKKYTGCKYLTITSKGV